MLLMKIVLSTMIPVVFTLFTLTKSNSDLIVSFLKNTNSKFCYFLVCWRSKEKLKMHKMLSKKLYIRVAYLPVEEGTVGSINDKSYDKVNVILDLSCDKRSTILQEISENAKFRFTYNWLMIGSSKITRDDIKNIFADVHLRMDTNVKIALLDSRNYYDIFEIYDPGLEVDLKINKVARLEGGNLTYSNKNVSYYESRKNMSGVLIRSANRANYSFDTIEDYAKALKHKEIDTFQKLDFQMFMRLIDIHGFHYNTTLRSWWFGNSTIGAEGGISQLLYENLVDISSSGGILRPGRMNYYDHYVPSYKFRTYFFFRNPGIIETGTDVLKPFTVKTWYVTVSSMLLIGMAIKTAYWTENRFFMFPTRYSLFTSIVITISVFAQQGSAIIPNRLGGRIILLTLLFLSVVLYNYYTSSLVSSLLSTQPPAIHTIKELYESDLNVGMEYQPYTLTYIFQEKNNYYIQKLNSNKIYHPEPNFFPPEEGLAMVKKGCFAYHTEASTAYPIISRIFDQDPICDLVKINFLTPGFVSLMAPKNSQYKELFQISLVRMIQNGILNREENIWVEKPPKCLSSLRVISVGANALFLVYIILVGGIFLATVILVIEIIWHKVELKRDMASVN